MADNEPPANHPQAEGTPHQINGTAKEGQTSRRRVSRLLSAGDVTGIAGCAGGGQDGTDAPTESGSAGSGNVTPTETEQMILPARSDDENREPRTL